MTNSYNDMQNTKCAMYIGSNAAEAHPVSLVHMLHAKETGAKMVVVPQSPGALKGTEDYIAHVDHVVGALAAAFK